MVLDDLPVQLALSNSLWGRRCLWRRRSWHDRVHAGDGRWGYVRRSRCSTVLSVAEENVPWLRRENAKWWRQERKKIFIWIHFLSYKSYLYLCPECIMNSGEGCVQSMRLLLLLLFHFKLFWSEGGEQSHYMNGMWLNKAINSYVVGWGGRGSYNLIFVCPSTISFLFSYLFIHFLSFVQSQKYKQNPRVSGSP